MARKSKTWYEVVPRQAIGEAILHSQKRTDIFTCLWAQRSSRYCDVHQLGEAKL